MIDYKKIIETLKEQFQNNLEYCVDFLVWGVLLDQIIEMENDPEYQIKEK